MSAYNYGFAGHHAREVRAPRAADVVAGRALVLGMDVSSYAQDQSLLERQAAAERDAARRAAAEEAVRLQATQTVAPRVGELATAA
ncbi:MAG TPA: hypothetical protein VKQ34_03225 [Candidatus Saccharimonadales bacterium]|nr:hypothetical protein [Candidatus Saccharimonadales bacterium]